MKKVRIRIPVLYSVSYVMDVPAESSDKQVLNLVSDALLNGELDLSDWETDPSFYDGLYSAVKYTLQSERIKDVEVEEVNILE